MRNDILISSALILVFSVVAALVFPGIFSVDDASLYLTVTGLIYGLLAAFAVGVSWDRYSRLVENLHEEISSESNLHEILKHFPDKKLTLRFDRQLLDYLLSVTEIPWRKYFEADKVHAKFRKLFDVLGRAKYTFDKDSDIWQACIEELRDAASARNQQIVLSNTPLSFGIWGLLFLLSSSVVVGVFLIAFVNPIVGIFTKVIMSISSFSILLILHQIDGLQLAAKAVEEEPNKKLVDIVKRDIEKLEFKVNK